VKAAHLRYAGADRGRARATGDRETVPGVADVGEPVAAGAVELRGNSQYRLAPLPAPDDCSLSPPGSSGNGALANVTLDLALLDNVPAVFRQSPEDGERRSSPAISSIRGQACNHELH